MPPTSQYFQVPASGKFEKLESVREHRQCLLFFTEKVPAFSGIAEKIINFFRNAPIEGVLLDGSFRDNISVSVFVYE